MDTRLDDPESLYEAWSSHPSVLIGQILRANGGVSLTAFFLLLDKLMRVGDKHGNEFIQSIRSAASDLADKLSWKELTSQFDGTCMLCGTKYKVGDTILWKRRDGTSLTAHPKCLQREFSANNTLQDEALEILKDRLEAKDQLIAALKKTIMET